MDNLSGKERGIGSPVTPRVHSYRRRQRPVDLTIPVVALSALLFSVFLSPQLSIFGRGLRSVVPLFALLAALALLVMPKESGRGLRSYIPPTVLGLLFVASGLIRNSIDPEPELFQNHVVNAAVCVMLWIAVIIIRRFFERAVEPLRWLSVLTLGVSLGLGLPLLVSEPGVARLTMADPTLASYNSALLFPKGVASYAWYTMVACAWPVMANWLRNASIGLPWKISGWAALVVASAAVMVSTFTMAVVLLVVGTLVWLILVLLGTQSRRERLVIGVILVLLIAVMPSLYYAALNSDATAFAVDKATGLFTGFYTAGLRDGDSTGRTTMFEDTIRTAVDHPILGAWGSEKRFYVGGHSSWADTFASQGILGLALWVGFLWLSLRNRKKPLSVTTGMAGGTLSWLLLAVGGALNPTFYSALGLALIWLFDEAGIWHR